MITGIGTPKSQSKIPRPIISSLKSRSIQERLRQCEVPVKVMESGSHGKRKSWKAKVLESEVPENEIAPRLFELSYQWPVFGIDVHGSAGGFASPFCSSSIECRSGERTKDICPSRGGRLMVMPSFIRRSQVA